MSQEAIGALAVVIGWTLAVVIGLLGVTVWWRIFRGDIDLSGLLSEQGKDGEAPGKASLSRFQFLIFTFVISLSLFWVIVHDGGFPKDIPNGIFILLGISAGTYGVSKGIQTQGEGAKADAAAKPAGGPGSGARSGEAGGEAPGAGSQ